MVAFDVTAQDIVLLLAGIIMISAQPRPPADSSRANYVIGEVP